MTSCRTSLFEDEQTAKLSAVYETTWASIEYEKPGTKEDVESKCAALTAMTSRMDSPAAHKLVGHRIATLKAVFSLVDAIEQHAKAQVPAGEDAEEKKPQDPKATLTFIWRCVRELKCVQDRLSKLSDENTKAIDAHIKQGEAVCKKLANAVVDSVMEAGGKDLQDLVAIAKGFDIPEDKESWMQLCAADMPWPDTKLILDKHLLPIQADKLNEAILLVSKHFGQYTDLISIHKAERDWSVCEKELQRARVCQACHKLAQAYAKGEDAGAIRRATRDEMAKLKRLGFAPAHLPGGMQVRIAAAMKGKLL